MQVRCPTPHYTVSHTMFKGVSLPAALPLCIQQLLTYENRCSFILSGLITIYVQDADIHISPLIFTGLRWFNVQTERNDPAKAKHTENILNATRHDDV